MSRRLIFNVGVLDDFTQITRGICQRLSNPRRGKRRSSRRRSFIRRCPRIRRGKHPDGKTHVYRYRCRIEDYRRLVSRVRKNNHRFRRRRVTLITIGAYRWFNRSLIACLPRRTVINPRSEGKTFGRLRLPSIYRGDIRGERMSEDIGCAPIKNYI